MRRSCLAVALACAAPARAGDLVDQVEATLVSAPLLRGRFEQSRTVPGVAQPITSSGTFVIARGAGLLWQTSLPVASTLVVTPSTVTMEQGGRVRTRIDGARAATAVGWMLPLLDGELDAVEKAFRVEGTTSPQGWSLALAPREPATGRAVKAVELSGDRHVRRITLIAPSGERTEIRIVAVEEAPAPLSPDERARLE